MHARIGRERMGTMICARQSLTALVMVTCMLPRSGVGSRSRTTAWMVPPADCAHIAWLIAASHSHLSSLKAASASTVWSFA